MDVYCSNSTQRGLAACSSRNVAVRGARSRHQRAGEPVLHNCPVVTPCILPRSILAYVARKHQRHRLPICRASQASGSAAESKSDESQTWVQTAILGLLFGGWYLANITFNIYNKQVLQVFPYPVTLTVLQFGVGALMVAFFWGTGLVKAPRLTKELVVSITPLAVVHMLGNLLTNCSLGAVAVSFTHTIKAMEPFFSVLLSALFLGEQASPLVLLSLVPIVGGVVLASVTEATFTWFGFLTAMASNITFQSRNVLSKKLMIKKDGLDNINLFSLITVLSFLMLLPFSLAAEGFQLHPAALEGMGVARPWEVIQRALLAGLCFHTYQQVSYSILQRVSPVTHSVGNCVKRVAVIVASVLVFQNPVTTQNAIGTATALAGVFLYSQVKRLSKDKPKA